MTKLRKRLLVLLLTSIVTFVSCATKILVEHLEIDTTTEQNSTNE